MAARLSPGDMRKHVRRLMAIASDASDLSVWHEFFSLLKEYAATVHHYPLPAWTLEMIERGDAEGWFSYENELDHTLAALRWLYSSDAPAVTVEIFNCRLRLVLDEDIAERLRSIGVDPAAAIVQDYVQDYEVGELLYGGAVCPRDCSRVARDLEANPLIARVEVLDDNLPCPG